MIAKINEKTAQALIDKYEKDLKKINDEKADIDAQLATAQQESKTAQANADKAKADLEAALA